MTGATRRTALSACLALGLGDLVVINLVLLPARRPPQPVGAVTPAPPVDVDVTPAPAPPPASRPVESRVAILFASGARQLDQDARGAVDRLARARAGARGPQVVIIEGHADARERHEDRLSRQRAQAVAARLHAGGVPREEMQIRGYGATRPAAPGKDRRAGQRNRRVEILVRP
jgi:outer membrane protein OmpA-like peptidoglycan-associated protein